jgi:leucyl-tRNA synthetase
VTAGVEGFGFNKAVAKLYEFTNTLARTKAGGDARRAAMAAMAQLMAPMVPHLAEEVWSMLGQPGLVATAAWPKADPALLVEDSVTLPIQINGKRRAEITVPTDMAKDAIAALVLANSDVQKFLNDTAPKKVIVVPGRIVNVVV